MISLRFLVFFYDESEDRHHRLAAVTPLFSTPTAVKTLMKTAKFEGRPAVVVSGPKEQLEKLVSQVERLDVTHWLALETWPELESKLTETVKNIEGLSIFETASDDQIVFGDDEVTAKSKYYPVDLPPQNRPLWDGVFDAYKKYLKGDEDHKAAAQRRLYTEVAHRKGLVPWLPPRPSDRRTDIVEKLMSGESKAAAMLDRLARHSMSEGLVKNVKSVKFYGADKDHEGHSLMNLRHEIVWTMCKDKSWKDLSSYLLGKEAFKLVGPRLLECHINQLTNVEIYAGEENKIVVHVVHPLTEAQVKDLIGSESDPLRGLTRLGKTWHETGKIV